MGKGTSGAVEEICVAMGKEIYGARGNEIFVVETFFVQEETCI